MVHSLIQTRSMKSDGKKAQEIVRTNKRVRLRSFLVSFLHECLLECQPNERNKNLKEEKKNK